MSSRQRKTPDPRNVQLGVEAGEWLLRLTATEPDSEEADPAQRDRALLEWLKRSPAHVKVFMETYMTYHRLGQLDPKGAIQIDRLLEARQADVIQLSVPQRLRQTPVQRQRRVIGFAAAAAVLALACGLTGWMLLGGHEFATAVGEQRACKLGDGSIVYLNTDSRIKIDYSQRERRVALTQGEALFVVEHDASRPFVVSSGATRVLAVGTAFNVRLRHQETEVAVVEGTVQVSELSDARDKAAMVASASSPTAVQLTAGEEARVSSGRVSREADPDVSDALSWRRRRLVFRNTPLAQVAEEFNRYNEVQIRIDGVKAGELALTGVFDADRPTALVLYAMKQDSLAVEHQGNDWVIRERGGSVP